jgi:hypothetical protein
MDIRSTVVSTPYLDDSEYEIELPESNHPVNEAILARAEEHDRRIAIRPSRLKELQELEKQLPVVIAQALEERKKEKLAALHKRDAVDRGAASLRAKRYVEKHRDEINARRREKRKQIAQGTLKPQSPQPQSQPKKIEHVDGGAIAFGI